MKYNAKAVEKNLKVKGKIPDIKPDQPTGKIDQPDDGTQPTAVIDQ
jgi:hypothetical protein